MPIQKLTIRPGIDRQKSQTLNEGGWSDASLVRFRDGSAQKYGGWQKLITTAFAGVCRSVTPWQQLNGIVNVGFGTNQKFYILQGGTYADVTPLDTTTGTGTLGSNPITTTNASASVQITHASHGRSVGDAVIFSGATAVNSITVSGEYTVTTVVDGSHYTITAAGNASGSGSGGGSSVVFTYLYPTGAVDAIFGGGWGAGVWGGNASFGTLGANPIATTNASATVTVTHAAHGRTLGSQVKFSGATAYNNVTLNGTFVITSVPTANTYTVTAGTTANASGAGGGGSAIAYTYYAPGWGQLNPTSSLKTNSPRVWSADNWGQDLIIAVRDGPPFVWTVNGGLSTRAVPLRTVTADTNAPGFTRLMLIGQPERHLIAFGSDNGTGTLDPLLVQWSDVENYSGSGAWTATATNSAGTFRLQGGTKIMSALRTQAGILIWTDTTCYLMSFLSTPYVYGFRSQGANSGTVSAMSCAELNGAAFWMSPTGFYAWRGSIEKLECTLHLDVFGSGTTALDRTQQEKVFCGLNANENEITWYYPSLGGGGECDRYITLNYVENLWYGGALPRTAYLDRGFYPNPIAVDPSGYAYSHEIGVDADGQAMSVYIESGYIDLSDGSDFIYVDRFLPDFIDFTGTVQITFKSVQYPGGPVTTKGPYTITPTTKFVRIPIRGRQVAIRITSTSVGDFWRLGAARIQAQPDGRR